jgi:oxidase EvaA
MISYAIVESPNSSGMIPGRPDMAESEPLTSPAAVTTWLDQVRAADLFLMTPATLTGSHAWALRQGALRHSSGRFFSVIGLTWQDGAQRHWQPFLDQREIGTLGFIARHGADGLELLAHAKTEPGNVGNVQLAPTCQATASTSDRVHGGAAPPYAAFFADIRDGIIADSRQSEQGSRFFHKHNRNLVVVSDTASIEDAQHRWLPFTLLRRLLAEDFLVNTDTRSVLCCCDWAIMLGRPPFPGEDDFSRALHASFAAAPDRAVLAEAVAALDRVRLTAPVVTPCALDTMPGWRFDPDNPITLTDGRLSIHHIRVHAATREVREWDQPLFGQDFEPTLDIPCGHADGLLRFGFQILWEPGLRQGAELAPPSQGEVGRVRLAVRQSDEGGRFFHATTRYRIVDIGLAEPRDGVVWLSLAEIQTLLPLGCFNNEARSGLSLLLSLA